MNYEQREMEESEGGKSGINVSIAEMKQMIASKEGEGSHDK